MILGTFAALALAAGPAAPPPRPVAPPPREAGARRRRPDVRPDVRPGRSLSLRGEVTAVDGESITVRGFDFGLTGVVGVRGDEYGREYTETGNPVVLTLTHPDRTYTCTAVRRTRFLFTCTLLGGGEVRLPRAAEAPRRFRAGEHLAAGGWHPNERGGSTYRLADVRVGDEVSVSCWMYDGEYLCRTITIHRRPGGRVPPAPGDYPNQRWPFHAVCNAWQDFEENGTPLPDDLDPVVQRRIHEEGNRQEAIRRRTAPEPREARPRPPAP